VRPFVCEFAENRGYDAAKSTGALKNARNRYGAKGQKIRDGDPFVQALTSPQKAPAIPSKIEESGETHVAGDKRMDGIVHFATLFVWL